MYFRSMSDYLTPSLLLIGPNGVGKTTIVTAVAQLFGLHLVKVNCHDLCGESSAASEARIKNALVKGKYL
jgi:MoxR-like ATPase